MADLVGNPEDRFSRDAAHIIEVVFVVPGRIANGHANNVCLKEKLQEVQRDRKELGKGPSHDFTVIDSGEEILKINLFLRAIYFLRFSREKQSHEKKVPRKCPSICFCIV